jgi:hypothetical protein
MIIEIRKSRKGVECLMCKKIIKYPSQYVFKRNVETNFYVHFCMQCAEKTKLFRRGFEYETRFIS